MRSQVGDGPSGGVEAVARPHRTLDDRSLEVVGLDMPLLKLAYGPTTADLQLCTACFVPALQQKSDCLIAPHA